MTSAFEFRKSEEKRFVLLKYHTSDIVTVLYRLEADPSLTLGDVTTININQIQVCNCAIYYLLWVFVWVIDMHPLEGYLNHIQAILIKFRLS